MKYILFTLLVTCLTLISAISVSATPDEAIKDIIRDHYVDTVSKDLLKEPAETIFSELDPYSRYVTREELDQLYNSIDQEITGIGITIQHNIIQSVIPGAPAEKAGLEGGDVIRKVDETSVEGMSETALGGLLQGEEGTALTLTVRRGDELLTFEVRRAEFSIPSVRTRQLAGDIGYMSISSFNSRLGEEISEILKENDAQHWILDFRNNPGGYVQAARQLAGFFPSAKDALLVEHRGVTGTWKAISQEESFPSTTSMLVNGSSASASEIAAGFYKDYNLGTIYGQTTFGKGLMQQAFEIEGAGAVLLSVNRFFTPDFHAIQGSGVTPDVKTYLPLLEAHFDALRSTTSFPAFKPIDEVREEKVFTVEVNRPTNLSSIAEHIEILQLGGYEVDATIKKVDSTTFKVNPETLVSGSEYVLTIEPGWTTVQGADAPGGILQRFSVK
ncbi:S41 family peptidase [Salimicrobium flavidum]|uniref:C-terminal peptidase (Prc) n=1 Tax=Salimicrobium flavidum TaxID=570947 RepID=A0A1N7J100_9BACI|nr:S41 family peptidase [Salimicrobium flavidum]SIS42891.1 C-terminal peptidase (prc) [Salimicrobium flavidum]